MPEEELPGGVVAAALELLEQGACLGRRGKVAAVGGWEGDWKLFRIWLRKRAVRCLGQPASSRRQRILHPV